MRQIWQGDPPEIAQGHAETPDPVARATGNYAALAGGVGQAAARPRVAVLFQRLGPYHMTRLNAATAQLGVEAVEFSRADSVYAWKPADAPAAIQRQVISSNSDTDSTRRIVRRMNDVLTGMRPDAVAIPGWSSRAVPYRMMLDFAAARSPAA